MLDTRNKIEQLLPFDPTGQKQPIEALLATLPQLEKDLQSELKMKQAIPPSRATLHRCPLHNPFRQAPSSPSSTESENTPG
jgi:hypothetical protein